jgi:DNA-binding NarL/FixJ family response regulator
MKRARILLADDQILLTEALTKLLEPQFEVVATVTDGRALLKAAAELKPDLIVLEVSLPSLNGLDAGYQLKKVHPSLKLLYLTTNETPETIAEAFRIGATGYLLKTTSTAELLNAIELGLRGDLYLAPCVSQHCIESFLHNGTPRKRQTELTFRQREVLKLLAEGHSMKEVAFMLRITARTVAYHKYRMMDIFDLRSTAALVKFAVNKQVA